jgi:hypothetical protein
MSACPPGTNGDRLRRRLRVWFGAHRGPWRARARDSFGHEAVVSCRRSGGRSDEQQVCADATSAARHRRRFEPGWLHRKDLQILRLLAFWHDGPADDAGGLVGGL